MILTEQLFNHFRSLNSKVIQGMSFGQSGFPYMIDDDQFIARYECIRDVWHCSQTVSNAAQKHNISRTSYYDYEGKFVKYGVSGLFDIPTETRYNELEKLVLLIKESRPSLSQIAIYRIAQLVPVVKDYVDKVLVSGILNSHGFGQYAMESDPPFWGRVQRTLASLQDFFDTEGIKGRDIKNRRNTFFNDKDLPHRRLECLRSLHHAIKPSVKQASIQYNIPHASLYHLVSEYQQYGAWSIIPATVYGKNESISAGLQLKVILDKLEHPRWSAQQIIDNGKLLCSRFVVNRIIKRWGLMDKNNKPVALDRYISEELEGVQKQNEPPKTAREILDEKNILNSRRLNRHFELICKKMQTHHYHICDPGALLLAPFVNDLGIVQSFETYGPVKLRGQEITNLALLNVFRILAGYPCVNHLSNHKDRSVALASGIGIFGSSSRFYEDTIEFKFDQLQKMKCDLVARAKQLGLIEGLQIAFDFHFKEFYGSNAQEQGIGKGPAKSGDLVAGFRPHVAWDLATNSIVSIAYYHGGMRSPKIIRQFCEQNIFPILDPSAIREIYMDSEYTKEADFQYFKEIKCKNGHIYLCLKQNPQIKKLIEPALGNMEQWKPYPVNHEDDEYTTIQVLLPKTKLELKIAILRNKKTKKDVRCFGTTDVAINGKKLLEKYRFRWIIENGIKDLVHSYGMDHIFSKDPERIEFEFYCVMVARLAYEHFLRTLAGNYLNKHDGNKLTLNAMRDMLFEKRNCSIHQDENKNLVLTILDSSDSEIIEDVKKMLLEMKEKGKNKVLWWNNRAITIQTKNQFDFLKV